ncbi:MAG: zinc ribbon domain-containing protein [Actinomycetota bacterium]|nr:zinc ribbon domain-containing protein [Actinomycetota bacterium]
MPIYEFRCPECEARFEMRRPADLSDAPAPQCPNGHGAARRVLSVFATAGRSASGATASPGEFASAGSRAPTAAGCGAGCACAARQPGR